jgi:hypothetical protein
MEGVRRVMRAWALEEEVERRESVVVRQEELLQASKRLLHEAEAELQNARNLLPGV